MDLEVPRDLVLVNSAQKSKRSTKIKTKKGNTNIKKVKAKKPLTHKLSFRGKTTKKAKPAKKSKGKTGKSKHKSSKIKK